MVNNYREINMTDETSRILILGEIKGTLNEFKEHTDRRFDEIKDVVSEATAMARTAQQLAKDSHNFSRGLVQKAGFVSGSVSLIFFGIVWVFEHTSKAIASIIH